MGKKVITDVKRNNISKMLEKQMGRTRILASCHYLLPGGVGGVLETALLHTCNMWHVSCKDLSIVARFTNTCLYPLMLSRLDQSIIIQSADAKMDETEETSTTGKRFCISNIWMFWGWISFWLKPLMWCQNGRECLIPNVLAGSFHKNCGTDAKTQEACLWAWTSDTAGRSRTGP